MTIGHTNLCKILNFFSKQTQSWCGFRLKLPSHNRRFCAKNLGSATSKVTISGGEPGYLPINQFAPRYLVSIRFQSFTGCTEITMPVEKDPERPMLQCRLGSARNRTRNCRRGLVPTVGIAHSGNCSGQSTVEQNPVLVQQVSRTGRRRTPGLSR